MNNTGPTPWNIPNNNTSWNNPLVNNFNKYASNNPNNIPFQNNQLINQNVHVMNNLNNFIDQHNNVKKNVNTYQNTNNIKHNSKNANNKNIIEDMLKPEKVVKNNKDVALNLKSREQSQKEKIEITNTPYKIIIKDQFGVKPIKNKDDLVIHKTTQHDRDIKKFTIDLNQKKLEKKKINNELKIEFHVDKMEACKEKFEYKQSFIKNMAYSSKGFDENKDDYVDFYKKHQKEAEQGKEMCDKILSNLIDSGLIKPDEIPQEL